MITDSLENAQFYADLSPRLDEAFRWLGNTDLTSLPDGTITIRAEEIKAIVQTYVTLPETGRRFEAHRHYIDIQYIVSGRERLLVAPVWSLEADGEYDAQADIMFYAPSRNRSEIVLDDGMFAVLYPQDGHMPMLQPEVTAGAPTEVMKIVVKVAV